MSFNFGMVTEFDDALSIHDPVIVAAAKAVTLPRFKAVFFNMMGAPQVPITQKEFEIYTRSKTTRNGVVGDGASTGWDGSATTALPIDADAAKGLTVGHVLKVESEVVIVKSVNRTNDTIDVYSRGAGGTTAAAHADQTAFTVLGHAGKDSELKNVESISESTLKYNNYIQTVFELLDWEKGAELERKGLSAANIIAILRIEAAQRIAEMLANMSLNGYKQLGSKTGNPYMSAGLLSQLADTNSGTRPVLTYNAAGLLTEDKLKAALHDVFLKGSPSIILTSFTNKMTMNGFNGANSAIQVNTDMNNRTAGMGIDFYDYEGMVLGIRVDADMPNDRIAIISPQFCRKGWLKDDTLKDVTEPAQSSREKRESIQGSLGFIVEGVGYDHCLMHGITQS